MDEHLLLHLPFSSSLEDHSRVRRIGIPTGTIEVRDGAAHFPGDAYIEFQHIALENRPFSFSVWIKPEGAVVGYGLLEQVEGPFHKHLHILMRDPDKPYLGFYSDDLRSTRSITQEKGWTHLTFQFTGSKQEIWIDGVLTDERPSEPYKGEKGVTCIGKAPMWNNVPTQCFHGAMRDLRLYDLALTKAQIRLLAGLESATGPDKKPVEQFDAGARS